MAKFGFGGGSVSPDAVQPSATKAFTRWLFGGADPMDRARAVDMELEQKRRDAAIRQAFLERLQGATGGGAPLRTPEAAPAAPVLPQITSSPLESGAGEVARRLGAESFGDEVPTLASTGPRVDMTMPEVPKVGTVPMRRGGPSLSLRENADWLLPAAAMGMPEAKAAIDFMDKAGPKISFVNGVGVDERDAGNVGREIPDVEKGQRRVYDESGRVIGVMNLDGYVQSVAELERARTGAREGAEAQFDVIEVPLQNGRTLTLPRSEALKKMLGGDAAGEGFGVKPSEAETSAAKVEGDAAAKARTTLPTDLATVDAAITSIDNLLKDPALKARTGLSGLLPPFPGTEGVGFDAQLKQLTGQVFLDAYASLRGAGAITEQEGQAATAAKARLEKAQSEEDFIDALNDLRGALTAGRQRAIQKAETPASAGGGVTAAPLNGGARTAPPLSARVVGQVYQTPRGPMKWMGNGWQPQ